MSGLACSRELVQRGYDVLIVEARSRIGGRLKSGNLELGISTAATPPPLPPEGAGDGKAGSGSAAVVEEPSSHPVDLGGALIHGIENNPIHSLTVAMGTPTHPISDNCLLLDANGWPFDPKEDEKLSTFFNECLEETFRRTELDKDSQDSFGNLFDNVCKERGFASTGDNPLLKWHQANLELPTGADFHCLGYTWNDDEPYGFTGAHNAIEDSWTAVAERLAEGLNIIYQSQVKRVQLILPNGTVSGSEQPEPVPQPPISTADMETGVENTIATTSTTQLNGQKVAPSPRNRRARTQTASSIANATDPVSPNRFSRRLRGVGASVRRSSRATKGVIQMLTVEKFTSALSYDDPTLTPPRKRQRKKVKLNGGAADVDVQPQEPSSTVQVTLQNGTVLEADAVVCALPLGVLKIPEGQPGHIHFAPPLPTGKKEAVARLGCGVLNKCALSFPVTFWQDSDFLGLAANAHSYLVLNAAKYTGKPILIFMYGGSFASDLESWTDSDIVNDCLAVLKKICGKEVPAPIDYCVTRWGQEKFSRMAFTYIPPGVDGPKQLAAMGDAIYDPVLPKKPLLMFAGEHTTPYHPSTIHGAFLSGIREAYRLDLFMEPELNENMEFEFDEKIYQHTFAVRRTKPKKKASISNKDGESGDALSSTSSSHAQTTRRRRRGGGMVLRKQPKAIIEVPPSNTAKKPAALAAASSPSRKSLRSLSTKKFDEDDTQNQKDDVTLKQDRKKLLDALEDRILARSLDSYGRDVEILRSKILPVFGSTRRRNADQIRSRWQQLKQRKSQPSDAWNEWHAEVPVAPVYPSEEQKLPPNGGGGHLDGANLRRSRREVKARVPEEV